MTDMKSDRRGFLRGAAAASAALATDGALAATTAPAAADSATGRRTMPARPLGATGMTVPILHLGTSQRLDQKYDKIMHRSFKSGVTWFDTALSYGWGSSHSAIANFIEQMGDRKQLLLTSKSGARDPGGLASGLDEALGELKTDYLDFFLMHGVRDEGMLEPDYLRLGERLKASGKTRLFGFSCHDGNVAQLMDKAARVGGIDVILFRYNFRRYGEVALNKAIDACHKAGIGLLAMKTMGSVPRDLEAVVDFRSDSYTLGQAKLKSVWADERIASVVSEMDSVQRVRENVKAAVSERSLTAEESHQLNRLAALTAEYACNGCSHLCEQAAGGELAIADTLRYLMYHECYDGKSGRAKELYSALPAGACSAGDDALARASAACPQGIDIAARMAEAARILA